MKKPLIVTISIIAILGLAGAGYYFYNKYSLNNQANRTLHTNPNTPKLKSSSPVVDDAFKKLEQAGIVTSPTRSISPMSQAIYAKRASANSASIEIQEFSSSDQASQYIERFSSDSAGTVSAWALSETVVTTVHGDHDHSMVEQIKETLK